MRITLLSLALLIPIVVQAQSNVGLLASAGDRAIGSEASPLTAGGDHGEMAPPLWLVVPREEAGLTQVFVGSGLGLVAGGAVGAGLGYLIYQLGDAQDADMFGGLFTVTAGAALGAAAGTWVGSRMANDHRGNPWLTAAGSLVGVAGGIGLGALLGDATESTFVGFAVAIPIAITVPALTEYFTSR